MQPRRSLAKHGFLKAIGAILTALIALPVFASTQETRPLQLEVFINGRATQLVASLTQYPDGKLAASRRELKGLGIQPPDGGDHEKAVALDELSGLSYHYDEPRQRLDLTVADERRVRHVIDARGDMPAPSEARTETGFVLNYLAYATSITQQSKVLPTFSAASLQFDARLFSPLGTIAQTGIVGRTVNTATQTIRLDTTYSFVHQPTATLTRIGDFTGSGPVWARPIRMGGLSVERNYGSRPDLVTAALPVISGSAAAPTTMDVYVNNVRTFSRELPLGPYAVANIPGLTGAGSAQIVLRDVSGREIRTALPFYTSASLLAPNAFDFSAQAGFARYNYAFSSANYGGLPLLNGSFRYGAHKNVTVEGHLEVGAGLALIGAGGVFNIADRGLVSLAGQASRYGGRSGFQIYAGFETRVGAFSLSASTTRTFASYADLAMVTTRAANEIAQLQASDPWSFLDNPLSLASAAVARDPRPPRALDRVTIALPGPFDRSSLGLSYVHAERIGQPRSHLVNGSYTQMLRGSTALSLNTYMDLGPRRDFGVSASLSVPLGGGYAAIGASGSRSGTQASLDISRPLGTEVGSVGYRLRNLEGAQGAYRAGSLSTLTPLGRAEMSADWYRGIGRLSAEFEGAIAAVGSKVLPGPRIDDAFVIVDAGSPGVDVKHENRRIGRTNRQGLLLVPGLVSYQRSTIAIDPTHLPLDAHIERTEELVTPSARGGLVLRFGIDSAAASGIVILQNPNGTPLRAGLKGRLEGGQGEFVMGHEGRAFVRGLLPHNRVVIDLLGRECAAEFPFSPVAGEQVVVGPLICR